MDLRGKIKWFNEIKGFGFITAEDGQDYFFHKTGMSPDCTAFEGAAVIFDGADGKKGLKAINVRPEAK